MKNISIMLKPASSMCNLKCKYCFYDDVSHLRQVPFFGIMDNQTVKMVLSNILIDLEKGDCITFAFQGGEPTLAGLEFYKYFISVVDSWDKKVQVSYAIQTNGILIDNEWCKFLKKHNFLVGISLDLLPDNHNEARVDPLNRGTYQKVLDAIVMLEKYEVPYNVLCTLTNKIAECPQEVWKKILELKIEYTQFTPCLDDMDESGKNSYALTPKLFASFYLRIFSYWIKNYRKGKYRSIKYFDDVIQYMAFGIPTACGIDGKCQPQLIIEADGSVYPCDFYCLDEYKLGNFRESTLKELFQYSAKSLSKERGELPNICKSCQFISICGGGCKRMKKEAFMEENEEYCGNQLFLSGCIEDLKEIAKEQIAFRGKMS